MPYTIKRRKMRNKSTICFSVVNKKKRKFSKCTTLEKAKKQIRLLRAIEFNPKFVPRRTRRITPI